jgi:hypothetical protein
VRCFSNGNVEIVVTNGHQNGHDETIEPHVNGNDKVVTNGNGHHSDTGMFICTNITLCLQKMRFPN